MTMNIILWDFTKKCDHIIETRRPDLVLVDKVKKRIIVDEA